MKPFHNLPFEFNKHDNYYGWVKPGYIQSDDGVTLAYYYLKAESIAKAVVILIHGAGAHCYMSGTT